MQYIVVKDALSSAQLADCRERLAQRVAEHPDTQRFGSGRGNNRRDPASAADPGDEGVEQAWTAPSLLEWGGAYLDLIDLPSIAPKLRSLFGDAPYRMDHDYVNLHDGEKPGRLYLHGGGQGAGGPSDLVGPTDGGQCYYRYANGAMCIHFPYVPPCLSHMFSSIIRSLLQRPHRRRVRARDGRAGPRRLRVRGRVTQGKRGAAAGVEGRSLPGFDSSFKMQNSSFLKHDSSF